MTWVCSRSSPTSLSRRQRETAHKICGLAQKWQIGDWMGPHTLRYQGLDGATHSPVPRKWGLDGATHSPVPRIGWGHTLSGTQEIGIGWGHTLSGTKEMGMAPFVLAWDTSRTLDRTTESG